MKKGKKRQTEPTTSQAPPELPEGRPMPWEANPGGTEGVNEDWPGGSSNIGEVLYPEPPDLDSTYSSKDLEDVPKVDIVHAVICERCGEAFQTQALLNVHLRAVHHPRRRAS